jgi:hypothetical protein
MTIRGIGRLFAGSMEIFNGVNEDQMAGRLLGSLRDRLTNFTDHVVRFRAGGVVLDERAVLIPSLPEPRMAALVALLVRSGAGYLGDEVVHVDPVLRRAHLIASPPLPILVNEPDLADLPELGKEPARRPRRGTRQIATLTRRPVSVTDLGLTGEPAPIRWIVFPEFDAKETDLQPVGSADALFRFTQAGLNLHIWTDRAISLMQELLDAASVWRLRVGSLQDAASVLHSLTDENLEG